MSKSWQDTNPAIWNFAGVLFIVAALINLLKDGDTTYSLGAIAIGASFIAIATSIKTKKTR